MAAVLALAFIVNAEASVMGGKEAGKFDCLLSLRAKSGKSVRVAGLKTAAPSARMRRAMAVARTAMMDDVITDVPEGKSVNYSRSAEVYYPYFGYITNDVDMGHSCDIVDGNDGNVYLVNPFSASDVVGALKGVRDGSDIKVTFPQVVSASDGGTLYVAYVMDKVQGDGGYTYQISSMQTVTYKYDSTDGSYTVLPKDAAYDGTNSSIIGFVEGGSEENGWVGYGEFDQKWTPATDKPFVPNFATDKLDKCILDYTTYYNYEYQPAHRMVYVKWQGNDLYVKGLYSNVPDAWVKGTLDGDSVRFVSGQYLGIDMVSNYHVYFMGGHRWGEYDSYWGTWSEGYAIDKEVALGYDKTSHKLTFASYGGNSDYDAEYNCFLINAGKEALSWIFSCRKPMLSLQPNDISLVPANPVITDYYPYDDYDGYGQIYFDLPDRNVDGYLLDKKNMYYNIICSNGEKYVFTPENSVMYGIPDEGITEPITDIPYDFSTDWIFYSGNDFEGDIFHFVYITEGNKMPVGVQSCYRDGDKVYRSAVVYPAGASGIGSVEAKGEPVSVMYYTVDGQSVARPSHGVYIKVLEYKDGTRRAVKVALGR